jgi:hypothetical protein
VVIASYESATTVILEPGGIPVSAAAGQTAKRVLDIVKLTK